MSRIDLPNGEWCNSDSDGITKHGQHYKGCGACGYVNWHLYDELMIKEVRALIEKRKMIELAKTRCMWGYIKNDSGLDGLEVK